MSFIVCRACRLWSARYDGNDPPRPDDRSYTPGDDVDEDDIIRQIKRDSITPPPPALSPTPSSSDTVSTGNQAGRTSSALELEWDDIFADDERPSSGVINTAPADGASTVTSAPAPPRHIQEMQRNATKLVRGSYVEESEFQGDVLVYDLVAQKDTKAAILERIMAGNRRVRGSISNGQQVATTTTTLTAMLTTTGRTVLETVNSIMSTRRRSEDGGSGERRSEEYGKEARRRSVDVRKEMERRKEEEDKNQTDVREESCPLFTNGFHTNNHSIDECDDADEDDTPSSRGHHRRTNTQHHTPCLVTHTLPNGCCESESHDTSTTDSNCQSPSLPGKKVTDNFLSQYRELMLSLGAEPDCDDIPDDISRFRRRVRVLRQRLEEGEGLGKLLDLSSSRDDGEEKMMEEEEEEEEEGEERRGSTDEGSRRPGGPFTGVCKQIAMERSVHRYIYR